MATSHWATIDSRSRSRQHLADASCPASRDRQRRYPSRSRGPCSRKSQSSRCATRNGKTTQFAMMGMVTMLAAATAPMAYWEWERGKSWSVPGYGYAVPGYAVCPWLCCWLCCLCWFCTGFASRAAAPAPCAHLSAPQTLRPVSSSLPIKVESRPKFSRTHKPPS